MNDTTPLVPLLVVRDAARAIDFYLQALGAELLARYEHGPGRRSSHADLALGAARFSLTEELRAWNSDAPPSLGGSPVVLQLGVADAAAAVRSLCDAGATSVFPLQEFLGELMARVRDPFGHLWIVHQRLEELTVLENQRRRAELFARLAVASRDTAPRDTAPRDTAAPDVAGGDTVGGDTVGRERAALPPEHAKQAANIESAPGARQAPNAGAPASTRRAPRLHLVIGPVGAGKSTFAQGLARDHGAVRLTLDDWMATLFSPDRPATAVVEWYLERAQRCIDQIWKLARQLTQLGSDVVLEIGLLQRGERERFYARVDEAGLGLTIHVLDADRDVRRARVLERNRSQGSTFSMLVPPAIFELASDLWQAPDADECAQRDIRCLRTDLSGER